MEQIYLALIHKDPDSDFGISFPDFPGCVTAGSTPYEAFEMAKEALAGHIETMMDEGLEIPAPRDDIVAAVAKLARKGEAPILVPVSLNDKAVRVNVMLPAGLLRRIDHRTDNRSGFLAQAAEEKLADAAKVDPKIKLRGKRHKVVRLAAKGRARG